MDSSICFNAAIRLIKADRLEEKPEQDIIQPLTTTSLPPQTPESSCGLDNQEQVYLPAVEHATAYIQRYFDEVHCLYWLFSTEQFHERLHETYMTGGVVASASWLCCLYSIFALGSTGLELPGQKKPAEYLMLAKNLISQVHDEADVDSVRALCLLVSASSRVNRRTELTPTRVSRSRSSATPTPHTSTSAPQSAPPTRSASTWKRRPPPAAGSNASKTAAYGGHSTSSTTKSRTATATRAP